MGKTAALESYPKARVLRYDMGVCVGFFVEEYPRCYLVFRVI